MSQPEASDAPAAAAADRPRGIRLTIAETLLEFGEPQIIQLKNNRGKSFLGLNVGDSAKGPQWLVVRVADDDLNKFLDGRVDLLYLCRFTTDQRNNPQYWLGEFLVEDGANVRCEELNDPPEEMFPDRGFFLAGGYHTAEATKFVERLRTTIDGRWSGSDFRQVTDAIEDSASLFLALQAPAEPERDILQIALNRHPWAGGISSVRFFDDVRRGLPVGRRPVMREIAYASPGFIDHMIDQAAAKYIRERLHDLGRSDSSFEPVYSDVHDRLSEMGMLSQTNRDIQLSVNDRAEIQEMVQDLLGALQLDQYHERIRRMIAGDPLKVAKVLLAFCRRLMRIRDYVNKGKASAVLVRPPAQEHEVPL